MLVKPSSSARAMAPIAPGGESISSLALLVFVEQNIVSNGMIKARYTALWEQMASSDIKCRGERLKEEDNVDRRVENDQADGGNQARFRCSYLESSDCLLRLLSA